MSTSANPMDANPGQALRRRLAAAFRRHWMIWLVVPMLLLDGCTGARAERIMCGPDAEPACVRRVVPCAKEQPRPALEMHRQVAPCSA